MSVASILLVVTAFGLAIHAAIATGDYRTLVSHQALVPFSTIVYAIMGALIASRQPRNPIGWIFLVVGSLYALTALAAALSVYGSDSSRLYYWAVWLSTWLWIPASILPMTVVLLIFPDGHLPSPRWRLVVWSTVLGLAMVVLAVMFHPVPLPTWGLPANPLGIPAIAPILDKLVEVGSALLFTGVIGSLAGFTLRVRRSAGIEREQMKWMVYAVGMLVSGLVVSTLAGLAWPADPVMTDISIALTNLTILGLAVAAAIAILRHRLYDINLIINRTLVWGALTAGVAALYGVTVGALGALFQARNNFWLSLLATGLVAIVFHPLRDRLQRGVNRLMYGDLHDPYTVLSKLGERVQATLAPEAVLSAVVETIAQALKVPYVAISLLQRDGLRLAAEYGVKPAASISRTSEAAELVIPLVYQSETLGELILAPPASGTTFTANDRRLLEDIARQAGVAAHAVRLTQDLQHSRELLVTSREEERRRLRRDLHDGLGPHLASLKLNLDVARNLVSRDPKAAEVLLLDLRSQAQAAIADIRRLVYDLRPPALDEFGLKGAIQEYARQLETQDGLSIRVDAPITLPPLPAAVEVAAYRITLEALANVVRHSQARRGGVSLAMLDKTLQVEVSDDGLGLPKDVSPGVGLNSMRERAAELGGTCMVEALPHGGTCVRARLPLI
ncbi:MAG: GAF domain-containing sensor histidine kinase [Anaerolineae bacterium]|nr:GAF domain-containing sensor histidine kinase [Anaerolineae bacterium]